MKKVFKCKSFVIFCMCVCMMAGYFSSPAAADQRKEVSLHYYRGVVYFQARHYEQALVEFQTVADIDPFYKDTQKYVKYCIEVLEEARRNLYKSPYDRLTTETKSFDLYFLGKSYYEKRDYRKALQIFQGILAKHPEDRFARYYAQLCEKALSGRLDSEMTAFSHEDRLAASIDDFENEVAYIKSDIKDQQEQERFLQTKAERKASRETLIRQKEMELKEQEELLEEERQDYLAQARIAKRAEQIKKEAYKWKTLKEKLETEQPGVPADLVEYPTYLDRADRYYKAMKESLRASRWNSAGLNAISASIYYCDAMLIYFYGVRSASPSHDNIVSLLLNNVKRSDTDENVFRMRSILNLKKIIEADDRPITRSEAIFLSEHAEKLAEWCRTMLP